ncbi:MAG: hypothetical protein E3J72_04195 [Planctomycetota bacterium]|nr:MAG: hypothetical protein E3J72_04195 [Planctomycetota bacterium]
MSYGRFPFAFSAIMVLIVFLPKALTVFADNENRTASRKQYDRLDFKSLNPKIRIRKKAKTRDGLVEIVKPQDVFISKYECYFLWVEQNDNAGTINFTLDRPYHFLDEDNQSAWGLLSPPDRWPVYELAGRHTRRVIRYPTKDHHDGNYSCAELLHESETAGSLYKVVYCGVAGGVAHSEPVNTFIVFQTLDNEWRFVAERAGGNRASKCGAQRTNSATGYKVNEQYKPEGFPFQILITQKRTTHWGVADSAHKKPYSMYRDAVIEGDVLPLDVTWENNSYFILEKDEELYGFLNRYMGYEADWVKDKEGFLARLNEEIMELNIQSPESGLFVPGGKIYFPTSRQIRKIKDEFLSNRR